MGLGAGGLLGALGPRLRSARADAGGPYLLLYWANGGWDQSFVFDPHFEIDSIDRDPEASSASVGDLVYASNSSRPTVDAFMATHGDRTAIINGVAIGSISHQKCTRLMMTGGRSDDLSDFPTRLAAGSGPELAMPAVLLSGPRFPGTLGGSAVAFGPKLSGIVSGDLPSGAAYSPGDEALLQSWLAGEATRLDLGEQGVAYQEGLSRYGLLGEQIGELALQDGAGFDEQLDTGLAALSRGLSRCMVIEGTTPDLSQWDTHNGNHQQQDRNFENAFDELSRIFDLLDATSAPEGGTLAEHTLVLAMSEMGRTPVLNPAQGKDHWPWGSLMAVGYGVRAGTFGATDAALAATRIDLETGAEDASGTTLTPQHLIAALHEVFGLDSGDGITPFRAPFSL